jgi:hypothetical protein
MPVLDGTEPESRHELITDINRALSSNIACMHNYANMHFDVRTSIVVRCKYVLGFCSSLLMKYYVETCYADRNTQMCCS